MALQFKSATGFDYVSTATPLPVTIVGGGTGDVDGPASATDNAIARFDGTTGKLIQNSVVTIADTTGNTAFGAGTITTTGALSAGAISGTTGTFSGRIDGTAGFQFRVATGTNYELFRIVGSTKNPGVFVRAVEATGEVFFNASGSTSGYAHVFEVENTERARITPTGLAVTGIITGSVQALSGAGAVDVTNEHTDFTSTGVAQALTLANGVAGQTKTICHVTDGGSGVLTPTTKTGFTTITFTLAGDSVTLRYSATGGWYIVGIYGAVAA